LIGYFFLTVRGDVSLRKRLAHAAATECGEKIIDIERKLPYMFPARKQYLIKLTKPEVDLEYKWAEDTAAYKIVSTE
jgi:hypothetical protein